MLNMRAAQPLREFMVNSMGQLDYVQAAMRWETADVAACSGN
jgi:hypothetical protein